MSTFSGICNGPSCLRRPVPVESHNACIMSRMDDPDNNVLCFWCPQCNEPCMSNVITAAFTRLYTSLGVKQIFWEPEKPRYSCPMTEVEVIELINVYLPDDLNDPAVLAAAEERFDHELRELKQTLGES